VAVASSTPTPHLLRAMAPPTPQTPVSKDGSPVEAYFFAVGRAIEAEGQGSKILDGILRFELSKEGVETIRDVDGKKGCLVEGGGGSEPNCTITMTEADFADMLSGKLSGMSAYMNGKMKLRGDSALAQKMEALNEIAAKYGDGWGAKKAPPKPTRPEWFDKPAEGEEVFQAWLGGKQNDCILKLPLLRQVMAPPECFHTSLFEGWNPTNRQYDAWVKMYYAEKKNRSVEEMKELYPVTKAKFEAFRSEAEKQFATDLADWETNYAHLEEGTFGFLSESLFGVADAVSGAATGVFDSVSSLLPASPFK